MGIVQQNSGMLQYRDMRTMHDEDITLSRRRDAAGILGCSESQVLKFERQGLLRRVEIPGLRAVRYDTREVRALALRWIQGSGR